MGNSFLSCYSSESPSICVIPSNIPIGKIESWSKSLGLVFHIVGRGSAPTGMLRASAIHARYHLYPV